MSVRAKFSCDKKTLNDEQGEVLFRPVTTGSPENKSFFKFTPGGEIKLTVVNPAALAQFEEGKCYYVDFTDADAPAAIGHGPGPELQSAVFPTAPAHEAETTRKPEKEKADAHDPPHAKAPPHHGR